MPCGAAEEAARSVAILAQGSLQLSAATLIAQAPPGTALDPPLLSDFEYLVGIAMSIDPTSTEAASMAAINDVATWAGLVGEGPTSAKGSLCTLGVTGAEHPRVLGGIPMADFDAIIDRW
eukprot:1555993-Pyramimonas_sp.AAC.1